MSPPTQLLLELFDSGSHVMICVKDSNSRYVAVNDVFVRHTQRQYPRDVIGFRASEFFPRDLAMAYEAQDRALLRTRRALRNQLEIIPDRRGRENWFLTTKILHVSDGWEPEIVAVSTHAQIAPRDSVAADGLKAAISLAIGDGPERLRVIDLARAARMTTDQLERAMRRVLGVSPKQYLMQMRLDRASMLIATTDATMGEVAARCGYYDQSQLSRYFKAAIGLTPGEYRATSRGALAH